MSNPGLPPDKRQLRSESPRSARHGRRLRSTLQARLSIIPLSALAHIVLAPLDHALAEVEILVVAAHKGPVLLVRLAVLRRRIAVLDQRLGVLQIAVDGLDGRADAVFLFLPPVR